MVIGDWAIDDAGQVRHLKCKQPTGSWGHYHNCWIGTGRISLSGYEEGRYETMPLPEMVALISKIQYTIWEASKEPYRGKI